MRLAVIGGGNMGGAILLALIKLKELSPKNLLLIEKDEKKRINLSRLSGCNSQSTLDEIVRSYDFIIIAVKPQSAIAVMELLAQWLIPNQVIISVMAGISLKTMSKTLRQKKIVRVMTNIPTLISEGMSVFFISYPIEKKERDLIKKMFSLCGHCMEVKKEDAIDAATAISGSGPGYLFYFAEQMITSAKLMGFSEKDAMTIVQKTFRGATLLWESQGNSPEVLRKQVSSPGGTTLAALEHFKSNKVDQTIKEGIKKAYKRAKELSS